MKEMNKSGIYKITCLGNGIIYIGSTNNFSKRKTKHFTSLKNQYHCNPRMQNAFNKYGRKNFSWEIVEYVPKLDSESKKEYGQRLEACEQYYLDTLLFAQEYIKTNKKDPRFDALGFNICPIAGNVQGRIYSEEAKIKQSLATKGKPGKPTSEATKQKQREIKLKNPTRYWLGREFPKEATLRGLETKKQRGYKVSEETKLKKSRTGIFVAPDGGEITVTNFTQFCRNNHLDLSRFCEVARGIKNNHRGYTLKQAA